MCSYPIFIVKIIILQSCGREHFMLIIEDTTSNLQKSYQWKRAEEILSLKVGHRNFAFYRKFFIQTFSR